MNQSLPFIYTKHDPWTSPVPSSTQKNDPWTSPIFFIYTKNDPWSSPIPASTQKIIHEPALSLQTHKKMIHEPALSLHLHKQIIHETALSLRLQKKRSMNQSYSFKHTKNDPRINCPFIYTKMIHDWHEPVPPLQLHK